MKPKCPRCGEASAARDNPHRPFCSERCKLIDLGNWLKEEYRVPVDDRVLDEDGPSPPPKDSPQP